MTNKEKFEEVFRINPRIVKADFWDKEYQDLLTKCCDNCVNGGSECQIRHCIHNPKTQACIAFERR